MKLKITSDVCRTCLQENANISIFDNKQLINKLKNVTQIEIKYNGLPDKICAECVESLTFCYDFKMQCKSIDDQLQSFVQRIESKFDTFVKHKTSQSTNIEIPKQKTVNNKSKGISKMIGSGELTENPLHFEEVTINDIGEVGNNVETGNTEINNVADIENESEIKEENISFEEFTFDENHSVCDDENIIVDKQQSSIAESTVQAITKMKEKQQSIASKLVHSNNNKAICLICAKTFSKKTSLKKHMKIIHQGIREFKCDICKTEFGEKSILKKHIIKKHSMTDEENVAYVQQSIKSILLHNPNEIICLTCAKTFTRRTNLERHILLVHENKRDFKCYICEKDFTEKSILKRHLTKKHSIFDEEKMMNKQQLIQLRLSRNPNEIICLICAKTFSKRTNLRKHIKIFHEGKQEFEDLDAVYDMNKPWN